MKSAYKVAALALLALLLPVTAFAAVDCYPACYTFTPPEGFVLAEGEPALWVNADKTANINIIVEENSGINPYDLTDADLNALRDSTVKVFNAGLSGYQGNVTSATIERTARKECFRISMDSSYVMDKVEIKSRQVQYIFFTKDRIVYVTGTALTDFAAETELTSFYTAAEALTFQCELFEGPTEPGNMLVVWVILGAIVGGAGGLTLYLLHQRKKTAEASPDPQKEQEIK